jgi:hypothetical protein
MYPIQLDLPEGNCVSHKMRRYILIEDAIIAFLQTVENATIPEIAAALSVNASVARPRVESLQSALRVHSMRRACENGKPSKFIAWALGEGSDLMTSVNDAKVVLVKAVQIGVKRDPWIEAIFGPAKSPAAPALLDAA